MLAASLGLLGAVGAAAPAQAAVVVGVCKITIGEPHGSTHVAGTINSYGKIRCTEQMPNLHIRATLEKVGGATWRGKPVDLLNVTANKELMSNSAIPCNGNWGTYRTIVGVTATFPNGFNPRYHSNTYTSAWRRNIQCGPGSGARMAPGAEVTAPEEEVTLSFVDDGTVWSATPAEISEAEYVREESIAPAA